MTGHPVPRNRNPHRLHPNPRPRRGPDSIADVERIHRMLVAIYSFVTVFDDELVEITAGRDYVRADHPIAQRNRDAFTQETNR